MVSRSPSGAAAWVLLLWATSGVASASPLQAGGEASSVDGDAQPSRKTVAVATILREDGARAGATPEVQRPDRPGEVPPPHSTEAPEDRPVPESGTPDEETSLPGYALPVVRVEATAGRSSPEQVRAREPTAAVSVIDMGERTGLAPDTASLLATVPGVHLQQLGGFGQAQSIALRGASSSGVRIMLDGIPLNGAGGITDLSRLPTAWLSRIEVLRGGGGAAYGSGALGGAINLVTRELSRRPAMELALGAGSFGAFNGLADLAAPVLGGEGLLLLHGATSRGDYPYLHDDTPGHEDPLVERRRLNNDAHLVGGLLRFRRNLGQNLELSVLGDLSLDARGVAGPALNPSPERREAHRRMTAAVGLRHASGEGDTLGGRGWVHLDDALTEGLGPSTIPQQFHTAALQLEASRRLPGRHHLSLELDLSGERFRGRTGQAEPERLRGGVAVRDTWMPLPSLTLVPAVRIEQVGDVTLFSPKLGAELELGRHVSVRANAGQSHRAPSFLELYAVQGGLLPNPNLLPERGLSTDVGVSLLTRKLEATLTAYYSLYENLIAYEFHPPALPRPYNFDAADAAGLEATVRAEPAPWVLGEAGWTWMRTRNLREDPRFFLKPLPYRPEHRGTLRLGVGPEWLRLRTELEAQSSQLTSRDGRVHLPARALLHASLGWRPGLEVLPLELTLEGRNLTDARVHDLSGYPLPPRSFHLSLRFRTRPHGASRASL